MESTLGVCMEWECVYGVHIVQIVHLHLTLPTVTIASCRQRLIMGIVPPSVLLLSRTFITW
jgi:hypothetical protein